MQFWLNRNSEKNNVVIQYRNGLILGSCGKTSYDKVEGQLLKNMNPVELFGEENISLIPWSGIQSITSESNYLDIELKYKIKKDEETIKVSFSHIHNKKKCLFNIVEILSDKLDKSTDEQSNSSVYLSPFLSLVLASGSTFLFYGLFPKPSLIIGGIWILLSIIRLITVSKEPARITHWKLKKRKSKKPSLMTVDKIESKLEMKPIYTHIGFASVIFAVYFGMNYFDLPSANNINADSKNELTKIKKSQNLNVEKGVEGMTPLIAAIQNGDEKIALSLITDGADVSTSHDGKTALDLAIGSSLEQAALSLLSKKAPSYKQEDLLVRVIDNGLGLSVIKKIVTSGADVNYTDEYGVSVLGSALEADADIKVIRYLLHKGASTDILVSGQSPLEYAEINENKKLAKLLSHY
jgi:hypothetical protein